MKYIINVNSNLYDNSYKVIYIETSINPCKIQDICNTFCNRFTITVEEYDKQNNDDDIIFHNLEEVLLKLKEIKFIYYEKEAYQTSKTYKKIEDGVIPANSQIEYPIEIKDGIAYFVMPEYKTKLVAKTINDDGDITLV